MKIKTNWFPLFSTNFIGVLNDNLLKNLICFIAILWFPADNKSIIISLASGLMVLPFILFSPWAGKIAKERSKAKIIRIAKLAEIPIMALACIGFLSTNIYIVMTAMFLMGLQSCMYSPSKYGIIRDIRGKEGISFGTGTMEMLTFTGVLIGTFLAGLVSDIHKYESIGNHQNLFLCGGLLLFALIGWATSTKIVAIESKPDEEESVSLNPIIFVRKSIKWAKNVVGLNYTVLALSTFWLIGSMIQMNLIVHCPEQLGLSNTATSMIMALVAIGIGLGCVIAGLISNKKVNMALVPIGGVGMGICTTIIFIINPGTVLFTILIMLTAFFAGLFKIPLNAFMQDRVEGRKLGHILGYNNIMVFTFILISAGIFGLMETLFNTNIIFVVISIFTWIITIVALFKIPGANKIITRNIKPQRHTKDYSK